MSSKHKRRLAELGKDLIIILLALSTLALLGRAQFYAPSSGQDWFSSITALFTGGQETGSAQPAGGWGQGGIMRPARIALRSDVSRYGVQYDAGKISELFAQLTNPLSDALAGAEAPSAVNQWQWREVLTAPRPSVYLDFLGPVPLADLAAWLSGGGDVNANLTHTARRLVLAQTPDGGVTLYYINEDDGLYYACPTTASLAGRLSALVEGAANNAVFAFEDPDRYGSLAPYTLICQEAPQPQRYAAANPVPLPSPLPSPVSLSGSPALDQLVRGLSFPPQSYTAYPITDGVSLQEGGDRLIISASGVISFRAASQESPRYPIAATQPDLWQIVDGAWAFVEKNLAPLCGDAWLYLSGVETVDGGVEVRFSYLLDGAPVYVGQEGCAARLLIRDGAIVEFMLQPRQYTATGETTLVLQERRAAAAMESLAVQGSELLLCYQDQGGAQVSAGWTAW